jgi:8-oxo-dGTP pyrophosphatase MutT (NUDIX family)
MSKNEQAAKAVFDPKNSRNQEYREGKTPAVRPKEAATLILVRRDGPKPQVLMGKRHAGHKFMPNKFVFPGGRVDPADSRIAVSDDLRRPVKEKLLKKMRGTPSEARARGMALAAIRETFEETGLIVGKPCPEIRRTKNPDWQSYFDQKVLPTLGAMDFFFRAITPPYRTKRFDTRFFTVDAEHIQGDMHDIAGGSDELLEVHWLTLDDARGLDLPNITRVVLDELDERLVLSTQAAAKRPVPFVYFRQAGPIRETL